MTLVSDIDTLSRDDATSLWNQAMNPSRRSTEDLLKARREKAERLQAQIAALESRKKGEDRRREVRRKFIVGGAVLVHADRDPVFREALREALRSSVAREADKAVVADLLGT